MNSARVVWLMSDTVQEISEKGDIPIDTLMMLLERGEHDGIAYHFIFPELDWIPGAFWRVLDPFGRIVTQRTDETSARKLAAMDGYTLERSYISRSVTKWERVDERELER